MAIYFKDVLVAGSGGTPDALPLSGGTMTGEINMDGNKITNLPAPTADLDAVTKAYLDNAVATAVADYLAKTGGTMTGVINMGGNKITSLATPTASTDAATKNYVDNAVPSSDYLPLSGGTMTGNINMGGNSLSNVAEVPIDSSHTSYAVPISQLQDLYFSRKGLNQMQSGANIRMGNNIIHQVADPTVSSDVATKGYVDSAVTTIMSQTYTGNGGSTYQSFTFQSTPKLAIVMQYNSYLIHPTSGDIYFGFCTPDGGTDGCYLVGNTLRVVNSDNAKLNTNNLQYQYVVFL